jgi:hypothetical protein
MKECVASMAGRASEGFFARKARCCKISGRVVKNPWGPGESHASSSVLLISFEMLAITTNEAMRPRVESSPAMRKFTSPVSPTLQAIVHVKTGWIESRYPSIIRASRRTSSAFRVDFPAVTSAELQTQERVISRNQPSFPAPNTH